tara:strand:+ start:77 stop:358 length:282 start_codon:yes stop_codon:yes gene_type:complete
MKFTTEHLTKLKAAIDTVLEKHPNAIYEYEHGHMHSPDKVKCLQTRFCYDLMYASKFKIGDGIGIQGDINGDYNDSHILTALKAVCPKVIRQY